MTDAAPGSHRPLTGADADELAAFTCRDFKAEWTEAVQDMVRVHLAPALDADRAEAIGIWNGPKLVAVAAWNFYDTPMKCRCVIVAVAQGSRHRGYGRRAKLLVLERAREAGAVAVISDVAGDNDPMINLNISLGASIIWPRGDREYCQCVIPLS